MAETISISDRRLFAWRVELDQGRWELLLQSCGKNLPQALLGFAESIGRNLTSFVAELRVGNEHQLLRPYSYSLSDVDTAVSNRVEETAGLAHVNQRARAIASGINKAHQFFRERGTGTQAMLMSPVNQAAGEPEHQHTAVHWLAFDGMEVKGWQLFLDIHRRQRMALMELLCDDNSQVCHYGDDLDLASNPVLYEVEHWNEVAEFVATVFKHVGIEDDPAAFVEDQLTLERRNRQEAELWKEPYVHAITQGFLGQAKQIITQMQLKIRGLTELDVREAFRRLTTDLSLAIRTFMAACGFLEFSFAPYGFEPFITPMVYTLTGAGSKEDTVHCPNCNRTVNCPVGHRCPGCQQLRPC